jgi:glycosyltransferase involved in cell wall biosynthesis
MQDDELQSEEQTVTTEPMPTGDEENAAPESTLANEPATTRAPAATASSYRDIIAERLARKTGGNDASTHSPMAHSSDVEFTQRPEAVTPSLSRDLESRTSQSEPPTGELNEGSSEGSDANLSGRDRARMRQQERAALRRQGPRAGELRAEEPDDNELQISEETPAESFPESAESQAQKDIIAERMSKRGGEPRERRSDRGRDDSRSRDDSRRREEPRREEAPRTEAPRERPREAIVKPRAEVPEGLTLRSAQATPRAAEEPRRREVSAPRKMSERPPRPEASPRAGEKGGDPAHALAAKLGISVVVPLFNEQDSLRELTAALKQQLMRLAGPKYEILYINDGSTDHSGEILQDLLATSSRVSVITFRRNLGKSAALAAGFAEAQYGIVITLDADLQDDPQEFVNLVAKLAEGYDLVSGWKKQRHDPMSKTGPSKFFNWVTGIFSGIKLHDFNCGLKAYRKEVTESLQVYGELHRYLPALAYWQGFRVTEIPVTHHPRKFGKSKFGSSRFFKGFLDLLSIVFTNRYGKRPLHLFGTIGTLMAIAGFIIDIWLTVEWALGLTSLSNRPILLLGLLLILVGGQLISLGLLGEMIVKNAASKATLNYQKEKGKPSAEARERRATRMNARGPRPPRTGPRPERRSPQRHP